MKKMMIFFLLAFGFSAFAQNSYKGVGYQKNTDEFWNFNLERLDDGSYTVNYPSLQCSSIWTVKKVTSEYTIYQEKLLTGLDKCVNNGFIFVNDDATSSTTQQFYFYDKVGDEVASAFGSLELVE